MFEHVKPLILNSSKVKIWFTSDLHFGHNNIIRYCNRPWKSVEEMDEGLIKNWNSVVGENDIVFNLGDFAFAPNWRWKEILSELRGHHYLILGNHDQSRFLGDKIMNLFEMVEQQMILKIDNRYVYLNHYPFLCYSGSWRGPENAVYALHGHVHSGPDSTNRDCSRLVHLFPYQYDVGVDNNNYTPVSWDKIQDIIKLQCKQGIEPLSAAYTE